MGNAATKVVADVLFNNNLINREPTSTRIGGEEREAKCRGQSEQDDEAGVDTDGDLSTLTPPASPTPVRSIVIAADIENDSIISALTEERLSFVAQGMHIVPWDGRWHFSDFVKDALTTLRQDHSNVIMLYECPSSSDRGTSFFNGQVYKFHDYPPGPTISKAVLEPCRYSAVNGASFPSYLRDPLPAGLLEHWKKHLPGFVEPAFVSQITSSHTVFAYLPVEHISKHVNDPHVHYHLAGKDALHLMTNKTTKLLTNTQDNRPCVCKTTHSIASKGVFVIRNDDDEKAFHSFLQESGNPTFIITQFIRGVRHISGHFFLHAMQNQITWFGATEHVRGWHSDTTIRMEEQEALRELLLPSVRDVVRYCRSLRFWGFCGVDVMVDGDGVAYLVDVHPRVTGSCPALLLAQRFNKQPLHFKYALFRKSPKYAYPGTSEELLAEVDAYNAEHADTSRIVINSLCQDGMRTFVNLGVYSAVSLEECESVVDRLVPLVQNEKPRPEINDFTNDLIAPTITSETAESEHSIEVHEEAQICLDQTLPPTITSETAESEHPIEIHEEAQICLDQTLPIPVHLEQTGNKLQDVFEPAITELVSKNEEFTKPIEEAHNVKDHTPAPNVKDQTQPGVKGCTEKKTKSIKRKKVKTLEDEPEAFPECQVRSIAIEMQC